MFKSVIGRRNTPIVNKIASVIHQSSSGNEIDEIIEEDIDLSSSDLDDDYHIHCSVKRKLDQISKEVEANAEKRRHKSLKDQPRPIFYSCTKKKK